MTSKELTYTFIAFMPTKVDLTSYEFLTTENHKSMKTTSLNTDKKNLQSF